MLKFYELREKMQTLSAQLSWPRYCELLSIDDMEKIKYYINICELQNLSVRQLRARIKSNEYERLPEDTKNKLINNKGNNHLIGYCSDKKIVAREYELVYIITIDLGGKRLYELL